MALSPAPLETARFGLSVVRGVQDRLDVGEIERALVEHEPDVVILRVPCEDQYALASLDRLGVPAIVADTLVYYDQDLAAYTPKPLKNADLAFEAVDGAAKPALDELVRRIFGAYKNHYSANPLLRCDLVAAYQQWVHWYLDAAPARGCFLIRRGGSPIGFATVAEHGGGTCEGVLYGVLPEAAGGGVYGDIIRFTQAWFKERGQTRMKVSTQVQNYGVQKVWSREGYALTQACLTLHLNAQLHAPSSDVSDGSGCARDALLALPCRGLRGAHAPDPDAPVARVERSLAEGAHVTRLRGPDGRLVGWAHDRWI